MLLSKPQFLHEILFKRMKMYLTTMRRSCKKCEGHGALFNPEDTTYIDCPDCVQIFNSQKRFLEASIPSEYMRLDMEELSSTYEADFFKKFQIILDKIQEILMKTGIILHRANDNSFGVTTAGIFMLRRLIELKQDGFYIEVNDLFSNMFNFGNNEEINSKRSEIIEYLSNVPVLLIDGFGMESGRKQYAEGFVYQKFCSFLANRCQTGKMTIICTDLKQDEFQKVYTGYVSATMKRYMYPIEVKSKIQKKKDKADILASIDPIFKKNTPVTVEPSPASISPVETPKEPEPPPEQYERKKPYKKGKKPEFNPDKTTTDFGNLGDI